MLAGSSQVGFPNFPPDHSRCESLDDLRGVRHPLRSTGVVARAVPQEVDEDITPGRARPRAVAAPMPWLAPVTSANPSPEPPSPSSVCIHLEVAVSLLCLRADSESSSSLDVGTATGGAKRRM